MGMQLRVVHETRFDYEGTASASYNQARLTPVTSPSQIVVHAVVEVSPKPWTFEYRDYFGTAVTAFEVLDPHAEMSVKATSTTQTQDRTESSEHVSWEHLRSEEVADRWTEYLTLPELTAPPVDFAELARQRGGTQPTPDAGARAVLELIREEITFRPGVTTTNSPAEVAWRKRAGVNQDMVHLALSGLRTIGIPARYVSGYVHPDPEPEIGETTEGDPHAWIEWWDGAWRPFDVAAGAEIDDRYVSVAFGRDYRDVRPISGIYAGAETSSMDVTVEVTRMA